MNYVLAEDGWRCQFLEADCKTSLRRALTFQQPEKIIEMAERGGAVRALADRQAMEYGIQLGRGAVWMNLTEEQYGRLR